MPRVDIERGETAEVALETDGPGSYTNGAKPDGYWEIATGENSDNPGIWAGQLDFRPQGDPHPQSCIVTVPPNAPLGELEILHFGGTAEHDSGVMCQHIFQIRIVCGEPNQPAMPTISDVQTHSITITTPDLPECADALRVEWSVVGQGNWQSAGDHPAQTPVDITGLDSGQAYSFRVVAINATHSGGTPSGLVTEFTICEAPSITNAMVQVIMSWQAVNGATFYIINRNGTDIATTQETIYTDALQAGVNYDYTVRAVNGASAESADSNVVSVNLAIAMR